MVNCNQCCVAMKGLHDIVIAGPLTNTAHIGCKHRDEQSILKSCFTLNPMPTQVDPKGDGNQMKHVPIASLSATSDNATTGTEPTGNGKVPNIPAAATDTSIQMVT